MQKIIFIMMVLVAAGCSTEPKAINYGTDTCDHCSMNIMDLPYGTELVTDKGKVYMFDSTECMLSYMEANEGQQYAHILTATMDQPGTLQNAVEASFLISENLPSPMGANITAFTSKNLADEARTEYGGDVMNFEEVKTHQTAQAAPHH